MTVTTDVARGSTSDPCYARISQKLRWNQEGNSEKSQRPVPAELLQIDNFGDNVVGGYFPAVSRAVSSWTRMRRKGSTSVTRPTVWNEPRSLSLMTVEGLMSTQTTLTHAGS